MLKNRFLLIIAGCIIFLLVGVLLFSRFIVWHENPIKNTKTVQANEPNNSSQKPDVQTSNLSEETRKDQDELQKLIESAHSQDKNEREKAVGYLLGRLKSGMTREEVETWIGPPFDSIDGAVIGEYDTIMCEYTADSLKSPGLKRLMTVHYKKDGDVYKFFAIRGPHYPD